MPANEIAALAFLTFAIGICVGLAIGALVAWIEQRRKNREKLSLPIRAIYGFRKRDADRYAARILRRGNR